MSQKHVLATSLVTVGLLAFAGCGTKKDEKKAEEEIKTLEKKAMPIKVSKTGLIRRTLKYGDENSEDAKPNQKVTVHYAGWLKDDTKPDKKGRKFDSSVDRGKKFTFTLGKGQVIKGWDKGVKGMKIGEKRRLTIPPMLAYGERGIPGVIPPKSTLIFEVERFAIR